MIIFKEKTLGEESDVGWKVGTNSRFFIIERIVPMRINTVNVQQVIFNHRKNRSMAIVIVDKRLRKDNNNEKALEKTFMHHLANASVVKSHQGSCMVWRVDL